MKLNTVYIMIKYMMLIEKLYNKTGHGELHKMIYHLKNG